MAEQKVKFIVNSREYEIPIEPQMTLLQVLREKLDLIGAKSSCEAGECGICTVLIDGKPILACCTLAITVKEKNILTIEGLSKGADLHPIQRAFIEHGGIQCGFCTPGVILTAKALLEENPNPTREEVKEYIAGNLCRCTGYVKMIDSIMAAAEKMSKGGK